MLKVLKFGGSSLADAHQFAKVKSIVDADPARRVVIVSAPGKRFSGAGAGGYPTGSNVLRDCLDIAGGCRSFYSDAFAPRPVHLSGAQGRWLFRCMGETFVRECSAREAFDAYDSYRKDDPHALLARYAVDEE